MIHRPLSRQRDALNSIHRKQTDCFSASPIREVIRLVQLQEPWALIAILASTEKRFLNSFKAKLAFDLAMEALSNGQRLIYLDTGGGFKSMAGNTVRALGYQVHGDRSQLEIFDVPSPKLTPSKVLVDVMSVGLNPLDYRIRRGEMGPIGRLRPVSVTASDFAGVVRDVGQKVGEFKVGQRVYGMGFQPTAGVAMETISVSPKIIAPIPKALSFVEASVVPLAALTAYQALIHIGELTQGKRVLINGASGGVGTFATQIAAAFGAEVTAVTSHRNLDWMHSLGARDVIDYTVEDSCDGASRYDLFFDCYGNRRYDEAARVLENGGIYISTIPALRTFRWQFQSFFRKTKSRVVIVRSDRADLDALGRMIDVGQVRPIVQRSYPLAQFRDAYAALESKRTKGKIAISLRALPNEN